MSKYELPSGAASIEAIVGLNTEKDYTTPLSKKNISKALMESLYINLEQQQEIAELKAELEQHDDQITSIEEANKEISDVANDKILGLMAMVESIADYIYNMEAKRGETILFRQKALNFIDELLEQK